ncbi:GFA family protein [Pelagibius litoralis]|nr:GFA family protein [Pelagibius litoralis]
MPHLKGSCHCGAVRFSVFSRAAVPYMRCYCSICRKTAGGGGYAINLSGEAASLTLEGKEHITVYQAKGVGSDPEVVSPARRHFCKHCGSALYVFDPRWPDLLHPFASAIDTPLPKAPESVFIMLDAKPAWAGLPRDADPDSCHDAYPELSLEDWHRAHGLFDESDGEASP